MKSKFVDSDHPPSAVYQHFLKLRKSIGDGVQKGYYDDADDFEVSYAKIRPTRWEVWVRMVAEDEDLKCINVYVWHKGRWRFKGMTTLLNGVDQSEMHRDLHDVMRMMMRRKQQTPAPAAVAESGGVGFGSAEQRSASVNRS